jgi:hypothetical protein
MEAEKLRKELGTTKLIAVSKLQPVQKIRELYETGQRQFGENYIQEALLKFEELKDLNDIEWHLIGNLKKNKVKNIIGKFHLIQSVDSLELAQVLSKQCETKKIQQKILIQTNIAAEESKTGFSEASLKQAWPEITKLPNLQIMGLMTMPPLTENTEEARPHFRQLRELRDYLKTFTNISKHPMTELSMGTSHDYLIAIKEGSTMVRLGTILFGERPSKSVK